MKKAVLTIAALACLIIPPLHAADVSATRAEKFYGKITQLDPSQKNVTVHNAKQDIDARFQWSEKTTIVSERKPIAATELKVGQSLMVSYVTENNVNKADRISVRQPFKKRAQ